MSTDDDPPLALIKEKDDESEDKQRKIIVNSIIKSETLYVESLNKVMQVSCVLIYNQIIFIHVI